MNWLAVLASAKDLAVAAAAVTTAIVAARGFSSWNRELRGKAEFEAAREMAKVTYRLRNAIQQARAPWIDASEFPETTGDDDSSDSDNDYTKAEVNARRHAHVFNQRLKPIYPAFDAFDAQVLEGEALWGPAFRVACDAFRRMPIELRESMRSLVLEMRSGHQSDPGDFRRGLRATVWGVAGDTGNEFSNKLDVAVRAIESFLRPHLSPRRPGFFERLGGMF